MKYLPLNNFPEYDVNPFLEKAITEISEHTVKKKVYVKGNRSIINNIINDNGEMVGHSTFLKFIEVDDTQFVKVYLSRFSCFYDLSKSAFKVFHFIIERCIVPDRDIFYFEYEEAKTFTGYSANNIIRNGLASLIEHNIIARSKSSYKYYLNPMVIFNGDRITFAETYVRKKKNVPNNVQNLKLEFKFEE